MGFLVNNMVKSVVYNRMESMLVDVIHDLQYDGIFFSFAYPFPDVAALTYLPGSLVVN